MIDDLVNPVQSAFVKGRQILDGPLMVNEIIQWYKRKKNLMIFKVDFDKAYDSVSWEYLYQIMSFMGFDHKWSQWITACLVSSRTSILINKSPIKEFSPQRGLRQCDPLSPFLFILVMEGLHVAIEDAVNQCVFRGALIGDGGFVVSHIFYADDTLFFEEWDEQNIANLVTILNFFYLVSGLKLNLQKSNLLGIGVFFNKWKRWLLSPDVRLQVYPFLTLGYQ